MKLIEQYADDARLLRESIVTAEILGRLPKEAFARTGNHNEHGSMTLAELLETYVEHLRHHLRFIAQKRQMVTGS